MSLKACLPKWLGLLAALALPPAGAGTQEIRALFIPDPTNPQRNTFVNVTPVSGYCTSSQAGCLLDNMSSIRLPLKFESAKAMRPGGSARDHAMFKVPRQWRSLTVTNADTGESETVEVRVGGLGVEYRLSDTAMNLTGESDLQRAHSRLWGIEWDSAPSPCVRSGRTSTVGPYTYSTYWKTPVEGPCTKRAAFPIPGMSYEFLDFVYELRTPNPLGMSSGLYTGSLSYSFGPGADYDMGDVMLPDDPVLTLDFVLDVRHNLKVDLPPGGEKIRLVPAGGWQSWLQAGRKPVRLFRDQTFHISSSSGFKMRLECEFQQMSDCAIRNPVSQQTAAVQVLVSLPNGLTDLSGRPVQRHPLRVGGEDDTKFQPGFHVDRALGTLHFEMSPLEVARIVQPGEGGRYVGDITVIWDTEI